MGDEKLERIAKVIARAGVCSRRDAEKLIAEGKVEVDGEKIDTPAIKVSTSQIIKIDGKEIAKIDKPRLWVFHKPIGVVTTHKDEKGRKTVFDCLPENLPRVISIGRLDINTEGLLLLTNDGELARHIELPATGWVRTYRVRVHGRVNEEALKKLKNGVKIDGVSYGNIDAKLERSGGKSNSWISISITEGKNREVRKICEHLGLQVNRLIRTSYGEFKLGNLGIGEIKEVPEKKVGELI